MTEISTPLDPKAIMPHIEDSPLASKQDTTEESQRAEKIRIKNRRKIYLDQHPEYFTSPDLELSGATRTRQSLNQEED
jgi:hypothetical protein